MHSQEDNFFQKLPEAIFERNYLPVSAHLRHGGDFTRKPLETITLNVIVSRGFLLKRTISSILLSEAPAHLLMQRKITGICYESRNKPFDH